MTILIRNDQTRLKIDPARVEEKAVAILNALERPEAELSILIVDDEKMTDLNRRYLGRKGPTNVIAFPMQEGKFSEISPDLLGDVAISADTAEREGDSSGAGFETRFFELLIHGVLHLFGYDHEKSRTMDEKMDRKARELSTLLNL
ncbi:Endoribonuclease YbeY [Candidatus Desulfarcum epimagneticum]|uniref:Endoribonuclease YbeY n=1 Tax=uncultured Desulfobacteraceae bacterium TaxID=218296 RepID=A0A484HK01_9BACT|nr:Endoribonuclease YbeY [uncultured Desulfobacteraceae bacterium]